MREINQIKEVHEAPVANKVEDGDSMLGLRDNKVILLPYQYLKKQNEEYVDDKLEAIPATWELIPISDKQVHAFNYDVTGTLNTLVYSVKFMRGGKDVTAIMQQSGLNLYNFERKNTYGFDDNNVSDASWNAAHVGAKTVTLTDKDIYAVGTLEVVYDETILETEYKRLTNGN